VKGVWHPLGKDLAGAMAEYGRRITVPKGGCAELIDEAFGAMKARTVDPLSPNTIEQYTIAATRLKKILKNFAANQVLPKHAAAIKRELVKTPNMCNRIMSFGRSVFAYALEAQLVDFNPFVGVRRHKERKRKRLVTQEEFDKIYSANSPRGQVIQDLLFQTGQRIDDVLAIDKECDLLEAGIAFDTDKSDKRIIVKWTAQLRATVARAKLLYCNARAKTLVHTRKGTKINYRTAYDQFVNACTKAKIDDTTPHDIRAMALTAVKNQHGRKAAQALGTHSDEKTTAVYLRDREVPLVDGPVMVRKSAA
jgi:integrase